MDDRPDLVHLKTGAHHCLGHLIKNQDSGRYSKEEFMVRFQKNSRVDIAVRLRSQKSDDREQKVVERNPHLIAFILDSGL